MFIKKKRAFFNIFLVLVLLSSQVSAAELGREYLILPKPVVASSIIDPAPPVNDKLQVPQQFRHFVSPVVHDLDRMEAVERALDEVSLSSDPIPAAQAARSPVWLIREVNPPSFGVEPDKDKQAAPGKVAVQKESKLAVMEPVSSKPDEPKTILLDDIMASNTAKPGIKIIYQSSVIIQSRNIQRFLAMDEGFLEVKTIDPNQIMVKALRYGGTFLNIWDDKGRRTIYVGVVFPDAAGDVKAAEPLASSVHEKPFRFSYSNDWNTYYFGYKNDKFKRQSYAFSQNFSLVGQTPFGYYDSSLATDEFNGKPEISSYTVGLSGIPIENTSLVNFRAFDANRYMSDLSMSNTRLRGFFTDIHAFDDVAGFSYSYGQKRPYFVFLSQPTSNRNSYINAFKFTLFPKDYDNQISLNAAQGTGSGHEDYLGKKAYSIEARKRIYNLYLNGEHALGNERTSSLAGARWEQGNFTSRLNFRQINKNFTTVSAIPGSQGEIGGMWTTDYDNGQISQQTMVDIYRQYLFFNPNNPDALNYSLSGQLRVPLIKPYWSDTRAYYQHTPGDISPRRNITFDQRISRLINFLTFKNSSIYVGGTVQKTRYEFSDLSAFDRYTLTTGLQVPLLSGLSAYTSYDHSWVHELATGDDLNPEVFNAGLYYNKQFNLRFSGNSSLFYRKEWQALGSTSYLSGEDSAGVSLGLSYNPVNDANIFVDARTRKVWPNVEGNLPYNDLDVRFGVRMSFDIFKRGWDPRGSVSGYVYKDKDGGGLYDKNYPGIAGVKVKIGDREVVTDKDGFYRMGVSAKSVAVTPALDSLPSGAVFSTPALKTVDIKQWGNSRVDFGLNTQTGVYGLVFVDNNANGTPDASDKFVKGIKVVLDRKYKSTTDSQGAFYFRNIAEGPHTIKIDINTLPIDMIPQIKLENKIEIAEGTTYLFHVPLKSKSPSTESEQNSK